jgi:hypothetical protein
MATLLVSTLAGVIRRDQPSAAAWGLLVGGALVFAAGLVDDLTPVGPRGVRNHLRQLAAGHMTSGVLKLLVNVGAAVVVIALQRPSSALTGIAGVVLAAGAANVWNGLDVRPGRAIKAFVLVGVPVAVTLPWSAAAWPALAGLLLGSPPALAWDLRERAMLGDSGANLIGFVLGVGLYEALSPIWVMVAAGAILALNIMADSVGFSNIIERAAALRWLDGLGRMPD